MKGFAFAGLHLLKRVQVGCDGAAVAGELLFGLPLDQDGVQDPNLHLLDPLANVLVAGDQGLPPRGQVQVLLLDLPRLGVQLGLVLAHLGMLPDWIPNFPDLLHSS